MHTVYVSLSSIDDVKRFADAANHFDCEVDVLSGRYVINAKSIMGLFSIDLAKPVCVQIHGSTAEGADFEARVADFITEPPKE